jgi:hypothetical protein
MLLLEFETESFPTTWVIVAATAMATGGVAFAVYRFTRHRRKSERQ